MINLNNPRQVLQEVNRIKKKRAAAKRSREKGLVAVTDQTAVLTAGLPPLLKPGEDPWRENPLPLAEFVESDIHMSSFGQKMKLWPEQQRHLEAFLGLDPKALFAEDQTLPYQEAFLVWGKGSGKDLCVALVQCWVAHILLCLKNPQSYLNLAPGESIDIPVIAYNLSQAKYVYFQKFTNRIKTWIWLLQTIDSLKLGLPAHKWLKDKENGGKVGKDHIELPYSINCWSLPSTPASGEGKNIIFFTLDELAAFASDNKMNQAKEIHSMVTSSARTRFGNRWKGFAISFPRHGGDYMMTITDQAKKGLLRGTYATIQATWDINPNVKQSDFADDFERDPEGSLAKFACKPPAQEDAYFKDYSLLLYHASGAPLDLLQRYLDLPEEELRAIALRGHTPIIEADRYGDPILDRRGFPKLARWFRGQKSPAGNSYTYWVHLDPGASGDAFGFAMGHNHQLKGGGLSPQIDIAFRWTGRMFKDFGEIIRPAWFADTVEQRQTITAREVDFRTVREFLYFLRQARGFDIRVTVDTWNSLDSIQELRQREFQVAERIVNKEDYDHYKSLVYSAQLRYYAYSILVDETVKLQLIHGTRVDAPRTIQGDSTTLNSHKDVADAVASVCRNLALSKDRDVEYAKLELPRFGDRALGGDIPVKKKPTTAELDEVQRLLLSEFLEGEDVFFQ